MAEYKQEQAAVAGFITGTLSGRDQFFDLMLSGVFGHRSFCLLFRFFGWPEAAKIQDSSFEQ